MYAKELTFFSVSFSWVLTVSEQVLLFGWELF